MQSLNSLKDTSRPRKARKRVGRGLGSKCGKTCGRGEKGAGARAGYKRRYGKEGGNMPIYMKMPARGFSNVRFRKALDAINLDEIDTLFKDGDVVSVETLREVGFINGKSHGLKILGNGELKKQLKIKAHAISEGAREKLSQAKIHFEIIE